MSSLTAVDQAKGGLIEQVLIKGDLSSLSADQRSNYYMKVCDSVGLNMLTKPFEYITLNGKLTLYALRSCTDQLRSIHKVSVEEMTETEREGVFIVTAKVRNGEGRTDIAKGAVNITGLKGEALANALMKAETKAKRRATLSICGLGMLDETEAETIPGAITQPASGNGPTTGEITPKQAFGSAKAMKDAWGKVRDQLTSCKTHSELEKVFVDCRADFATFKAIDEQLYDSLVQVGVNRRNAINDVEEATFDPEEVPAYLRDAEVSGLTPKAGISY